MISAETTKPVLTLLPPASSDPQQILADFGCRFFLGISLKEREAELKSIQKKLSHTHVIGLARIGAFARLFKWPLPEPLIPDAPRVLPKDLNESTSMDEKFAAADKASRYVFGESYDEHVAESLTLSEERPVREFARLVLWGYIMRWNGLERRDPIPCMKLHRLTTKIYYIEPDPEEEEFMGRREPLSAAKLEEVFDTLNELRAEVYRENLRLYREHLLEQLNKGRYSPEPKDPGTRKIYRELATNLEDTTQSSPNDLRRPVKISQDEAENVALIKRLDESQLRDYRPYLLCELKRRVIPPPPESPEFLKIYQELVGDGRPTQQALNSTILSSKASMSPDQKASS